MSFVAFSIRYDFSYAFGSQERRERLKKMGQLLQQYDEDQSGDLDFREITNLITQREIANGRDSPAPSPTEISWILQAAGKHRANVIDATELELALKLWDAYVRNRAKFEKMFSIKLDTIKPYQLEFDQLKLFLSKLTRRQLKVSNVRSAFAFFFLYSLTSRAEQNSEVRAIIHEVNGVDGINLMQLTLAAQLW